jgi:uncharacterized protein YjbI with pentapeptide repeats
LQRQKKGNSIMDTKIMGGKIAKARKDINISQAQLALQLFISPQAVGKWERGESVPDIITMGRLAEILGVDLNYFSDSFGPAGEGPENAVGNNSQKPAEVPGYPNQPGEQLLTNFSGGNLSQSDFAGVMAPKRKFHGSAMRGSDFAGADLSGSSFNANDMRETNFDGANLTDCSLYANSLMGSTFNKTILVRTEFSASGLDGVKFIDAELIDVKLTKSDLRKTNFENCVFSGVDFSYSDLRGLCLDGQTFTGVKFHNAALNNASFKGATLKNVSFRSTFAITNKYYKAISTINFDGAMMDKLTYASLKGLGAELSKVTTI